MSSKALLQVGRIGKAHGIRGELSVIFNAESLGLLGDFIFLAPEGRYASSLARRYNIADLRVHKGAPLVFLTGVNDRSKAESLQGQLLFIPRERLPALLEDEVYLSELIGLSVFVNDGSELPLGVITRVDDAAGQELWTITTPKDQEVIFPAHEQFVVELDPDNGRVLIDPPPGLLELYLQ